MPSALLLSGSPSTTSRSHSLLIAAQRLLLDAGVSADIASLRQFPADDLIQGRYDSPVFESLKSQLASAQLVIVATPIYKASFSGGLKTVLDILPQHALRGKTVLPIATGGSPAHLLAIDYALKPVLSALGATDLLQGVYATEKQLSVSADGSPVFIDDELDYRFRESVGQLIAAVRPLVPTP